MPIAYWLGAVPNGDRPDVPDYFFESTQSPFLLWVRMDDLDVSTGAPSLKLTLTEESAVVEDRAFLSGNLGSRFAPAEPFAIIST